MISRRVSIALRQRTNRRWWDGRLTREQAYKINLRLIERTAQPQSHPLLFVLPHHFEKV
jgi:hypothetical protein